MDMNTQIRNESAKMNMVKCIALYVHFRPTNTKVMHGAYERVIENGEERKKEKEHFQMPISFL